MGDQAGMKPWVTRTLIIAFVLSVLVHLLTLFGEQIYAVVLGLMGEKIEVHETQQSLAEQEIALEEQVEAGVPTKPLIDTLNVYLVPAAQLKPPAAKPKVTKPARKKPAQPVVVDQPVKPAQPSVAESSPEVVAVTEPAKVDSPVIAPSEAPNVAPVAEATPLADATPKATPSEAAPALEDGAASGKAFPQDMRVYYTALGIGEAVLSWKQDGNAYTIELKAAGLGRSILGRAKGAVTKAGLKPDEYREFRDGKLDSPKYVVTFDWAGNTVSYGDPNALKHEPINAGALDILSMYFQVALRGSKTMDRELQIITGKKLYTQRYHIEGESMIHVPGAGDVNAILVKGENERGRGDFWLAPEWYNLPIKVNLDLAGKMIVPLDVTKVEVAGKVLLSRPKPPPPRPKRDR
ncbi:hypothetical protein HNQ59_001643 [Chitinivorax tropicus]|uniref:DUF3108 domain-containing protein n=1 Tax=Chitinivorax tropicus TaxID=714531 RepID=A0A840MLI6_9PROT|nr:DUF3108 domain-containing protein [Chitinivorax tropicus]MBB5018355.1 hypothetical protein [Chitinivorax tropicus]